MANNGITQEQEAALVQNELNELINANQEPANAPNESNLVMEANGDINVSSNSNSMNAISNGIINNSNAVQNNTNAVANATLSAAANENSGNENENNNGNGAEGKSVIYNAIRFGLIGLGVVLLLLVVFGLVDLVDKEANQDNQATNLGVIVFFGSIVSFLSGITMFIV